MNQLQDHTTTRISAAMPGDATDAHYAASAAIDGGKAHG